MNATTDERTRKPRRHRLMLFGGGGAGTAMARAAVASGNVDIVAICEPDKARRPKLKQEFQSAEVSPDYETLITQTRPTIADIASPDHLHTEHALAALAGGCDVLVEKPLATSVKDALQTIEAAERNHAILAVNYTLRYQYPTEEALQHVLRGRLGQPFLYQGFYVHDMWDKLSKDSDSHTPWRIDTHNPQDVLLGGGCHPIDLILTCAQSTPIEVSAYANSLAGSSLPINDCYVVNISFENGTLANVLVTTGCNGVSFTPGYFNVYGTEGTIIQDTIYCRNQDPQQLTRLSPEPRQGHNWQAAFERFIAAVDGLSPTPVPTSIAALNVAVCQAAIDSVSKGKPVIPSIPDIPPPWGNLEPAQLMMCYSRSQDELPAWQAPDGFELRCYRSSDGDQVLALLRLVGFDFDTQRYQEFLNRAEVQEGTHVVTYEGTVVGTAFAGRVDDNEGRIDYVIANPEFGGNRIGYAVCEGVMRYLLAKGYKTVVLATDDWRLPAIVTYLNLGFAPLIHREDMQKRWDAVQARLKVTRSRRGN